MRATTKKAHVLIGFHLLCNRTIQDIKFDKTQPKFMDWFAKENIFIEADTLGIDKTATIGYLTKLHTYHMNRTELKQLLQTTFEDVILDPDLTVELDPSLKEKQTEAMLNGDMFNPEVPPFEVFKTKIIHGRDKEKVSTNVIGIKCATAQARLLREFFSQMASPVSYEKQIGLFIPTGMVHILGSVAYAKMICDNNAYLQSVITIPVGDFQHETLDIPFSTSNNTDIEQTTLQETIEDQPWCLNVERTKIQNKILIVTTTDQLEKVQKWIDNDLLITYSANIADKIDVTSLRHLTPRCLDKPVLTAASKAYADNLSKRTSYAAVTTTQKTTQPPKVKKAPLIDLIFDPTEFPKLTVSEKKTPRTKTNQDVPTTAPPPTDPQTNAPYDYKAELERMMLEIETTLRKHCNDLFAKLESKINNLVQQNVEQAQINLNVTKQLSFLVDSIKKMTNYPTPMQYQNTPSPQGEGTL